MARPNLASGNSQYRPGYSERAGTKSRRTEVSALIERKWFEFDRNIVTGMLDNLHRAIDQGASEMEMIATEQMFDGLLSGSFSRIARHLGRAAIRLEKLALDVSCATGYPKSQKS
jgi:hypothetical protein